MTYAKAKHSSLKHFYPYRLSVLANMVSGQIADKYQEFNLSIPMWRVMAILADNPNATATDIARLTAMDKTSITRSVKLLLDMDYIKRKSSKKDGRYSHLRLTKEGQSVYNKVMPEALAYEKTLLGALNEAERAIFNRILTKLSDHCQAIADKERR